MPRVYALTAGKSKKARTCTKCRESIEQGQPVYQWSRRFGRSGITYWKHQACGRPKPTELSSRKTAQVEEAVNDAMDSMQIWQPDLEELIWAASSAEPQVADPIAMLWKDGNLPDVIDIDASDLQTALEQAADSANEVAEEYGGGADSMPENLQYGSQAEAMRDVAGRLHDWADTLRDWNPSATLDLPSADDYEDEGHWLADVENLFREFVDETRSEAKQLLSEDLPEYEG